MISDESQCSVHRHMLVVNMAIWVAKNISLSTGDNEAREANCRCEQHGAKAF